MTLAMLEALPTQYDYTDPATNLADYDRLMPMDDGGPLAGVLPDVMEQNRFLYGAEYIPLALGAYYGYSRGGLVQGLIWGLLGYMAPLPAVGAIAYEQQTGSKLFPF